MSTANTSAPSITIVGGGPAGLMAAEVISQQGYAVDLYDAMPSLGRKFLMAGKSGLNITHAESIDMFLSRYGARETVMAPIIQSYAPQVIREWVKGLGIDTFVGSSGRVFPAEMKAAPLLRAWLHRLRTTGVRFHVRHRWLGFDDNKCLRFDSPKGERHISSDATLLALGGGSWARLGSTGEWVPILSQAGIDVSPLKASNCGFEVDWSDHLRNRFAGEPLKSVTLSITNKEGELQRKRGDFVLTQYGIEGSLVYTFSSAMRDLIERDGRAVAYLDLLPDVSHERVVEKLSQPRGKKSLTNFLRRQLGINGIKMALVHELVPKPILTDPEQLAAMIKALPITCERARPIDEAISTAGGVAFEALDENLMLKTLPGVFCAGEMLDWDAPTGGYLITTCLASGYVAGQGMIKHLAQQGERSER